MPYKDPEVRKIKAAERNAKRWARIKEDPLLLSAYRSARTECERRRREKDPYRGKTKDEFLADCRRHTARRKALKLKQFIEGEFHVDHVIPLSKGGMHGYVNVQPVHPACNWSKGNRG